MLNLHNLSSLFLPPISSLLHLLKRLKSFHGCFGSFWSPALKLFIICGAVPGAPKKRLTNVATVEVWVVADDCSTSIFMPLFQGRNICRGEKKKFFQSETGKKWSSRLKIEPLFYYSVTFRNVAAGKKLHCHTVLISASRNRFHRFCPLPHSSTLPLPNI